MKIVDKNHLEQGSHYTKKPWFQMERRQPSLCFSIESSPNPCQSLEQNFFLFPHNSNNNNNNSRI